MSEEIRRLCITVSVVSVNCTGRPTGTANSLAKWDGYVQWDTAANRGTAFKLTNGTATADCSGPTTCTATFTWTRPTYYGDFDPQAIVQQTLWVYPCSPNTSEGCNNDSPFSGTSQVVTDNSPTGTQAQHTGLDDDTWHIAAVRMEWNDENTFHNPYKRLGIGYVLHGTPGGNYTCSDCASGGPAIIFKTAVAPTCDWNDCGLGSSGVNACADFASGNSRAYQTNPTGLAAGDIIYQEGCTAFITDDYIAFGDVPGHSYFVNTSGEIQNGSSRVECSF